MDDASGGDAAPRDVTEITICDSCKGPALLPGGRAAAGGPALFEAVRTALAARPEKTRQQVRVRAFSCLMNCTRPCSAAIASAEGRPKIGYVLAGFAPGAPAAEALIDYALGHCQSADGVVDYAKWPEAVKGRFAARMPPPRGGEGAA